MTAPEVKAKIKAMKSYDIAKLSRLAEKSGIQLCTINFWWNAIKN